MLCCIAPNGGRMGSFFGAGASAVLSKYLAKKLGSGGITVIAPGTMETDFGGSAVKDNE